MFSPSFVRAFFCPAIYRHEHLSEQAMEYHVFDFSFGVGRVEGSA
jgi:hypothetical protein